VARILAVVLVTVGTPLGLALTILVTGLLNHAGLWATGATRQALGLTATFRTLLYGSGAGALVTFPLALLATLPGFMGSLGQLLHTVSGLLLLTWYGLLYARAHRTETWRGILGVWLPTLLILFCCGACLGSLLYFGGDAFREGFTKALQGGA